MISAWRKTSLALERFKRRTTVERRITPDLRHELPFESLRVTTEDNVELAAWYVPPPAPTPWAVVLHHHFGGQKAYVIPWLALFHRLGVAGIAFDARGHGGSGGLIDVDSFEKRGADARAAVRALKERGHTHIVGFGQSQGAAVLTMGISHDPSLRGFIFDSGPAPEMLSAVWGVAGMLVGGNKDRALPHVLLASRIALRAEPFGYLRALWPRLRAFRHRPLLWLHGDHDRVIPRSFSGMWFNALALPRGPWRAVRVPGAGHVQTLQVGGTHVEGEVARFLEALYERAQDR